jgi:hypothetical protein
VAGGSGIDSMLRFQLERGGDGMKFCRKMKRKQRAHLGSIGRKHGMAQREATLAGGETAPQRGKGGDDASWADVNLTGPKNKENPHGRFSYYKWTVKI